MHLGSHWPFVSADDSIEGVIFRIHIREKTGRCERSVNESFFAS